MNALGAILTIAGSLALGLWAILIVLLAYHLITLQPGGTGRTAQDAYVASKRDAKTTLARWATYGLAPVTLIVLGIILDAGAQGSM